MILDDNEKLRFIEYLETTANACFGIAKQFEKLGGENMRIMSERETTKAKACLLIAADLKNCETITL